MELTGSLHSFKGSIHKIYKYKGKNNFTVEKSDRYHFNQGIKVYKVYITFNVRCLL